jgi:hypothetical protein
MIGWMFRVAVWELRQFVWGAIAELVGQAEV